MAKRIYHHCDLLEEAPMWGNAPPSQVDELIDRSADLLREPDSFRSACRAVLMVWPYSTEHNLSARCMNRKAWMGWAACCVNHNSTEYTTRNAWRMLDEEEQERANEIAGEVIKEWENARISNRR